MTKTSIIAGIELRKGMLSIIRTGRTLKGKEDLLCQEQFRKITGFEDKIVYELLDLELQLVEKNRVLAAKRRS